MNIKDLSCVSIRQKELNGAAAIIYRIFKAEEILTKEDRQADLQTYKNLIKAYSYANFDS